MAKSPHIPKRIVIVCGTLIVFLGFVSFTLPLAQADAIVPLVRNTPTNEAYTLVENILFRGALIQAAISIVLGGAIVVAAS